MKEYDKCAKPREGFRHEFTPKKKYLKFFNIDEFDNFMLCLRQEAKIK